MNRTPTLQTERLILRPLEPADTSDVRSLGDDERVAEMTLLPHPFGKDAAESWVRSRIERAIQGRLLPFSIMLRQREALCGHLGLALDEENENARLYYWLGVSYWGHGYATEAGREAISYVFEELELRRVYADCFARNKASGRVLEKLGMRREGCMRDYPFDTR